ncbi:MAG: metalloregulator ArsR/SmtB family transcription factor [Actinomycetota bacterium]|nr:metalloregulator ArsR/SmtB family transcription factor [Actinomycetota bacterium]
MDVISLLADPTRRKIIELLTESELAAGEIASHFDIARPGVSRHLRQLREGGLVSVTRSGQKQIYRLEPDQLMDIDRWLTPIRSFWNNRLDALDTELHRGQSTQRDLSDTKSQRQRRSESA